MLRMLACVVHGNDAITHGGNGGVSAILHHPMLPHAAVSHTQLCSRNRL